MVILMSDFLKEISHFNSAIKISVFAQDTYIESV